MNNREARAILQPIADQLHLMFEEEKAASSIPDKYKSIGQLIDDFEALISSGSSLKQAREALGVTSRRLLFEANAKGKVKVNTRHAAELIPKTILKWIRESEAVGALPVGSEKAYTQDVLRGWRDSDSRTRELTQISATNWQNGHFQGAQPNNLPPGPTSGRNAHPEIQPNYIGQDDQLKRGNSSHGSDPRANLSARQMENWGIAQNWWDDAMQFFAGTGTNLGRGPTQREALQMDVGVNPDQLLAQADRQQQLSQQPLAKPNTKAPVNGPVTVVRPANNSPSVTRYSNPSNDPNRVKPIADSNPGNLMRIARNTAPMWASLPIGAAVLGQSAHAAVTNPNADTIETALWDGANLVADGLSLVPIPMVVAGAEAAQKTLGIAQAARQGQKYVQQQNLRPSAPMPRPAAVPQTQSRPRTATVARTRGRTMTTSAPLDPGKLINNFIQSGYKAVFGNRES
jgi:hypothetical protein